MFWVQRMKGGAHPSPFAALALPDSKEVFIYCSADKEYFQWPSPGSNSDLPATFCPIT